MVILALIKFCADIVYQVRIKALQLVAKAAYAIVIEVNAIIPISGLLNTQMKTQVKNILQDIDGVEKVSVDLARGSVEVDYSDSANENDIRQGIEKIGCRIM